MLALNVNAKQLQIARGDTGKLYVLLYRDAESRLQVLLATGAAPALPAGGTAVDVSAAAINITVKRYLTDSQPNAAMVLNVGAGIAFTGDGTDGLFEVTFPAAQTAALAAPAAYLWDLVVALGADIHTLAIGQFKVLADVTTGDVVPSSDPGPQVIAGGVIPQTNRQDDLGGVNNGWRYGYFEELRVWHPTRGTYSRVFIDPATGILVSEDV